jgi:glycosyltransferase involved in cell wall biosynthesis
VIGIDASRALVHERTGTETYTFELLRALAALNPLDDFELYLNASSAPPDLPPDLGPAVCIPFPRLWTHVRLSARLATRPPGVLFVPAHVVPAFHPRTVVAIHDLGYLHFPEAHPPRTRRMLDLTTRWSIRAAREIIAISEATKADLIRSYGIAPARITVVHHGVDPDFHPRSDAEIAPTLNRLGIEGPYVLAVGTYQPRKNFGRLAAAMEKVAAAGLPHLLVIAGKRGWLAEQVDREIAASGQADRITRLGYVASPDLQALYAGASAFCLPSLHEGFGMPVLEAMASGAPVVTSHSTALAEVAGNAALLVDPLDVDAIDAALVRVLTEPKLARILSANGLERASEFTWRAAAEATLAVLRRVRDTN